MRKPANSAGDTVLDMQASDLHTNVQGMTPTPLQHLVQPQGLVPRDRCLAESVGILFLRRNEAKRNFPIMGICLVPPCAWHLRDFAFVQCANNRYRHFPLFL